MIAVVLGNKGGGALPRSNSKEVRNAKREEWSEIRKKMIKRDVGLSRTEMEWGTEGREG